MKKLLLIFAFLLLPHVLLAADSTILALPETITPAGTDMLYIVTDPSGAPVDNKITIDTLMGLAPAETDPIRNVTGLNSFANAMCWGDGDDKWCIYVSGGATPKLVPVCNDVENDCDHVIQLKTGKKFSITNNAGAEIASLTEAGVSKGLVNDLFVFRPAMDEPPATLAAAFDTRNSRPILTFADAVDSQAVFTGIMPTHWTTGTMTVTLHLTSTATSGTHAVCISWEKVGATVLDTDSNSFHTPKCGTVTVSGTSGVTVLYTTTFTQTEADGVSAGDEFRICIERDGDANGTSGICGTGASGTDSAAGVMQFAIGRITQ